MGRKTEFYLGLFIWLLTIPIAFSLWLSGDSLIYAAISVPKVALALLFFAAYLFGYLMSHGFDGSGTTRRLQVIGLLIALFAIASLSLAIFYFGMTGLMGMMLVVQLSSLMQQKWAMLVAFLIPTVIELSRFLLGREIIFSEMAVWVGVYEMALLIGYRVIAERAAKMESEQLVRELKATQVLLSATTKRDERHRIARDLHDVLGHHLTALGLQLEVANHVDGEAQEEHIQNAQKISASLLSRVRETVSEFRNDNDLKLGEALKTLIEGLPNLDVVLNLEWDESKISERQAEVLFRCAQEALTNTIRHAEADRCEIHGVMDEEYLVLQVDDNGTDDSEVQPGNGLQGMIERAEKLDGTLKFTNAVGGFSLTLKLPLTE